MHEALALELEPPAPIARVTEIHLPFPPSANHIWKYIKAGKVRRSAAYEKWLRAADNLLRAFAQLRGKPVITSHFTAEITLSVSKRAGNLDCDNRIKAVLDYAQSRMLIANDSKCDQVTCAWGIAPHGCKLVIKEVIA